MAEQQPSQNRPASPQHAPDPATSYERAKPEKEAGQGSLDSPVGDATPEDRADELHRTVRHAQPGDRQINAHDDRAGTHTEGQPLDRPNLAGRPVQQPDHSMHDEEPTGWDHAPTDIHDPRQQRHPRTGGKGGTPNAGESRRNG
jgi:hypothetical protein